MLVEVRVSPGKEKLRRVMENIQKGAGLKKKRTIPHLTLYGEFDASGHRLNLIARAIEKVGKNYDFLPFVVDVDELITGKNRAGTYSGGLTFIRKFMQGLVALILGVLLQFIGYILLDTGPFLRPAVFQ